MADRPRDRTPGALIPLGEIASRVQLEDASRVTERLEALAGKEIGAQRSSAPAAGSDVPVVRRIGASRGGRPIFAARVGDGPRRISLVGGAHADEPLGPACLLAWLRHLLSDAPDARRLRERATWSICPHVNPDGAAANALWASRPLDFLTYATHVVREAPGDDIEFGYPRDEHDERARPENLALASFLSEGAPYAFHASLHGMAFADGAWFLIEQGHAARTVKLRETLARIVADEGLPLFDLDRGGEKGFFRIAPGFSTTPTSTAMRAHFETLGDSEEAARFRPSSMELVQRLGGDPLAMVSEIPLFLVRPGPTPGSRFPELRRALRTAVAALFRGDHAPIDALRREYGLEPVPTAKAARIVLAMVLIASGVASRDEIALDAPARSDAPS